MAFRKKAGLIFVIICLGIAAVGCGIDESKIIASAEKSMTSTESYYAVLDTVIFTGGKPKDEYHVAMWYKAPDCYRVDITDKGSNSRQVFLSCDGDGYIYEPRLGDVVPLVGNSSSAELPPFALQSYWETVVNARELALLGEEQGERESYYIVELTSQETDSYSSLQKAWLEKRSLLPVRVEVFGEGDILTRIVSFERVTLNLEIDDSFFDPDKVRKELLSD